MSNVLQPERAQGEEDPPLASSSSQGFAPSLSYPPTISTTAGAASSFSSSSHPGIHPRNPFPPPPPSAGQSSAPAGRSLLSTWVNVRESTSAGARVLTLPPSAPAAKKQEKTFSRETRQKQMLRSFSSSSSGSSSSNTSANVVVGDTSESRTPAPQVPRRRIAHNPSFLHPTGQGSKKGGTGIDTSIISKSVPATSNALALVRGATVSNAGGKFAADKLGESEWAEEEFELFDVDLEMARGASTSSASGPGKRGSLGRSRRISSGSNSRMKGEEVSMQKLKISSRPIAPPFDPDDRTVRSGTGSGKVVPQLQAQKVDEEEEEQGQMEEGSSSLLRGSSIDYDITTAKISMNVWSPDSNQGKLRQEEQPEQPTHPVVDDHLQQGRENGVAHTSDQWWQNQSHSQPRHDTGSAVPSPPPPDYSARPFLQDDTMSLGDQGYHSHEEDDDDDDDRGPPSRGLDRSYLDHGTGCTKLDFEPLSRNEKWVYASTALVVFILATVGVAIGGDWIDIPGDGIGPS